MVDKNILIEKYVPLANKLAHEKKKTLPRFIDFEEIQSAAYMGLVEAASRYDEEKKVTFPTFAYPRISGAIIDYLRQQSWGKKDGEYQNMQSLDNSLSSDDKFSLKDIAESNVEINYEEIIEVFSQDLGDEAGDVMKLYFVDEYSMKEVGKKYGVSESRVSQLISSYKKKINKRSEEILTILAA